MSNDNYSQMLDDSSFSSDFDFQHTQGIVNSSARQVSLTLDDISEFSLNPRRTDNPKYEEILESIRTIGLENPLVVTKRPGEAGYTLFNGGSTRLRALKALWAETQELKYYHQDCKFVPYSSDSELLIRHMIENEVRGEMTLLDKALAALKIKQLAEQERGQSVSSRALADLLAEKGWKVSFVTTNIYLFAAEHLAERIPKALSAGMGRAKIEEIRKLYHAIKKYVDERLVTLGNVNAADIQNHFLDAMIAFDDADPINIAQEALREACEMIAVLTAIDAPRVHFEIMHIYKNGEVYSEQNRSHEFNDLGQRIAAAKDVSSVNASSESTPPIVEGDTLSPDIGPSQPEDTSEQQSADSEWTENKADNLAPTPTEKTAQRVDETPLSKAQELLQGQITFLRMRYSIAQRFVEETPESPYFLPTTSLAEMLAELEQNQHRYLVDEVSEADLVDVAVYVELANLFTAWYRVNYMASTDDETRRLYLADCLHQIEKINDKLKDLRYLVHGYRCGFWFSQEPVLEVLQQFDKLYQHLRSVAVLTADKDSS